MVAPTRREFGGLIRTGRRLARTGRAQLGRERSPVETPRAAVLGVGRVAGQRTATLLDAEPAAVLVSLGFAGGLDPKLRPGDLVVASSYRNQHGATAGDHGTAARTAAVLGDRGIAVSTGAVLTVDEPLLTPGSKQQARDGSGGLVVDMEGFWVAIAAEVRGVPHIGLHCVLDDAGFTLPAFVAALAADPPRWQWTHALRALRSLGGARDVAVLALRARTAARVLKESAGIVLGAVSGGTGGVGAANVAPGSPAPSAVPAPEAR